MLDGFSLPVICANDHLNSLWFVHLKHLMNHPILKDDEKLLWLWLATLCTNNASLCCSLTYEQIACAVNKSVKDIHRILFRLKIMGLLMGNIPIWYGKPKPEMHNEMRHLKLVLLKKRWEQSEICDG